VPTDEVYCLPEVIALPTDSVGYILERTALPTDARQLGSASPGALRQGALRQNVLKHRTKKQCVGEQVGSAPPLGALRQKALKHKTKSSVWAVHCQYTARWSMIEGNVCTRSSAYFIET
jgi:hypothetical protein